MIIPTPETRRVVGWRVDGAQTSFVKGAGAFFAAAGLIPFNQRT